MSKYEIVEIVELKIPAFANAVKNEAGDKVIFTQAAFSESEICLLGAAIKYAGYQNKTVEVIQ